MLNESSNASTTRTTLIILTIAEALVFLLWASLHLGVEVPLGFTRLAEPRIIPAFIVETLCGLALIAAAWGLITRQSWAERGAFYAYLFAFAGVILGMTALAVGAGPRTLANDLYHIAMTVALIIGLLLLRRSGTKNMSSREQGG